MDNFLDRAKRLLNLQDFNSINSPIEIITKSFDVPFERQYVLRMLIRSPESNGLQIPPALKWLEETILTADKFQKDNNLFNEYVYITIRHGLVTSETEDMWHVDGFSMSTPHVPEQNYIWTNTNSTEYAEQSFPIPKDFDPFKHNLHLYLNDNVKEENIKKCKEQTIYLIDPYIVHRRPMNTSNTMRTFWRISFIPIEIKDDTCQQNPLLPIKRYNNTDIRKSLINYQTDVSAL